MIEKPAWRRPLLGVVLLLAVVSVSLSAGPGFWQAATQADFLRGEVDQLSIDEHGRLTLGPELTRVHDAAAPFVWAAMAGADGTLFLGTGNDGKVIKVDEERPGVGVLRQHGNGSARARRRAGWWTVRGHIA